MSDALAVDAGPSLRVLHLAANRWWTGSADPIIQLRVADRDQARQQKATTALPDEGLRDRSDGAIVRQQDTALCQAERLLAEPRD